MHILEIIQMPKFGNACRIVREFSTEARRVGLDDGVGKGWLNGEAPVHGSERVKSSSACEVVDNRFPSAKHHCNT